MSLKPLEILKQGFRGFSQKIKQKKDNNEANIIDEQHVLEQLELASDYKREVACLDNKGKAIVEKLREWADADKHFWTGSKKEKENKVPKEKPVPAQAAPVFMKKENATLAQRIEILNWYHKHKQGQTKTAEHFVGITYPNLQIKQPLQTEHPEVSEMLDLWVSKVMADGVLLTGEVLHQKWNMLKLSNGGLMRFKKRNGLKEWRCHGEAGSLTVETVEEERKWIQKIILEGGYELKDLYNMDKTGLFYA
ncbi:hypothetical protein H4582DRAFT_2114965 [Lactarius indigo]|nr:hypothetical protein H4582DRAFT_2114965 [Lactarius indigo]